MTKVDHSTYATIDDVITPLSDLAEDERLSIVERNYVLDTRDRINLIIMLFNDIAARKSV